jgi:site-specific recombinase XerD
LKIWSYNFSTRINGKGRLVEQANKYFEALEVNGFSPATIQTYAFVLITFFRWLKEDWQSFEKFTQKNLQDWMISLSKENFQPHSINQRLSCVRTFFQFCFGKRIPDAPGVLYRRGYFRPRRIGGLNTAPVNKRLELHVKTAKRLPDPMTPKEIDRFIADIDRYRDLGITLIMLLCGLRRKEVTLLRVTDIDFHQGLVRVMGKGSKERVVPTPPCLCQVLEKYLTVERPSEASDQFFVILQGKRAGQPMSTSGIRSLFRKRRERLDIPKARPHQFRHAFASDLARAGVPLTTIQKLLGHADPRTSVIYIELFIEDIKAELDIAMKKIEARYAALSK